MGSVVSGLVNRVTMLEASLSQLVQTHIQMFSNPSPPPPPPRVPIMIEPIDVDDMDIGNVMVGYVSCSMNGLVSFGNGNGNGEVGMTDVLSTDDYNTVN